MKTSALLVALLATLPLPACGGLGSLSSAVCDEYEKAFAGATKDVDAVTEDMIQKSFEQTKEASRNLPADQHDAAYKTSLDALKGVPAAETPEGKIEEAKDAAEEAKEAAEDAREEAK